MLKYIFGFLFSSIAMFSFADDNDKSGDGDQGSEGETNDKSKDEEKPGEDDGEGQKDDEPKLTHTEKEVNAAAAKGRKGAMAKLLKKLGVDSIEDAEAKLKQLSEVEAADNTDLENANKAIEKLTEEFGDQGERVKILLSKVVSGAVIAEARDPKYGINPEVVSDLWKLIQNDEEIVELLEIDEDTFEVTGIDKAIKAAIKGRDYMLVEEEDSKKKYGSPSKGKPRSRDNSQKTEKPERVHTL